MLSGWNAQLVVYNDLMHASKVLGNIFKLKLFERNLFTRFPVNHGQKQIPKRYQKTDRRKLRYGFCSAFIVYER